MSDDANASAGKMLFESYCAACHQADGQGTQGSIPPLAESSWVRGSPARLIRIVLHGVRGAIEVEGQVYELEMPGFGQILSDTDIGSLLSFVREQFSSLGRARSLVSTSEVSKIRAATDSRSEYWTAAELLKLDE